MLIDVNISGTKYNRIGQGGIDVAVAKLLNLTVQKDIRMCRGNTIRLRLFGIQDSINPEIQEYYAKRIQDKIKVEVTLVSQSSRPFLMTPRGRPKGR